MARLVVNQTHSIDVPTPGAAWSAFDQALGQVSGDGGEIEVMPGDYVLDDSGPVAGNGIYVAGKKNVTIRLHAGATIRPGSGVTNLLTVTGARFTLCGSGTLKAAAGTARLLNVAYVAAAGADSADFLRVGGGVRFDMTDNTAAGARAINCLGQGTGAAETMRHVEIDGCHFYPPTSSGVTTTALMSLTRLASASISRNFFGSRDINNTVTYANKLVDAVDVSFPSIADNVTRYVSGVGTTPTMFNLVTNAGSPQEAGHGCVGPNNRTENGTWSHLVYIGGVDFMTCHGNNWGRHSEIASVIRATYKADASTAGRSLAIYDEHFHSNDGSGTRYAVHLDGFDGVQVSGLQYYNLDDALTLVQVDATATGVAIDTASMHVVPADPSYTYTLVNWADWEASSAEYLALDDTDDGGGGAFVPHGVRRLVLDGSSSGFSVNLPPADSSGGRSLAVERTDAVGANTVTLTGVGNMPVSSEAVLISSGAAWIDVTGVI